MSVTLAPSDATQCAACGHVRRCVAVTIADDPGDMTRSALTVRSMTAAVCLLCVQQTLGGKRHHGRTQWDAQGRPES